MQIVQGIIIELFQNTNISDHVPPWKISPGGEGETILGVS